MSFRCEVPNKAPKNGIVGIDFWAIGRRRPAERSGAGAARNVLLLKA